MRKQTFAAVLFAGAILGFGAAEMIHAQVPGYATKVLMKTDLQNLPGQEAIFYASDWPSGFRLPWHVQACARHREQRVARQAAGSS